ncbi:hypothetical protein FS837_008082 [Tulasnella sp. UAMH 9824]|nr:hypothetical protein FS837_008082 [Tulasnella sp. UAMH 9824]
MLGIGANRPDGPEAIAWKQNQDFESVLKRLNQESQSSSATPPAESEATPAEDTEEAEDKRTNRKEEKRRRKEEKRARKEEKTKGKLEKEKKAAAEPLESSPPPAPQPAAGPKVVRMAHRARHRASKAMLSSATALAEVLGESSSAPTPREPSPAPPKPTLTPISDENITTSTINMADYFRSKIQAKAKSTSTVLAREISQPDEKTDEDRPSFGLGAKGLFSFPSIQSSYGPSSKDRVPGVTEGIPDVASKSDDDQPVGKQATSGEEIASKPGEEIEEPSRKKKRRSSEAQEEEVARSRKKKKKRKD